MKKWKVVLGIVFIFILGAIAGGIVGHGICRQRPHWGEFRPREEVVKKLDNHLHLDPDQKAKVEVIINDAHNQMREVRKEAQPKIEAIMNGSQEKISSVLRPDQKDVFEKMVARWKERQKKMQEMSD